MVVSACCLLGCREKDRPQLFIDQKTKDYVVFQQGSWWSYVEKQSQSIDTISIFLQERSMKYWEGFAYEEFEMIDLYLNWYLAETVGEDDRSRFIRILADVNTGQNIGICEELYPWFLFPNIVFIPFDTVGEHRAIWENDTLRFTQFYDTLTVNGVEYYEVMELSSSLPVHAKKQKRIWWAKNVGRIKWENFGGEVWELTNHNVIQ